MALPVALDAMGGDHGCAPNIEGAVAAVRSDGASVVLVGDEATIRSHLERLQALDLLKSGALSIVHAPEEVGMDEKPAAVLRKKKQSSMHLACGLVDKGEACGAVSCGNSGAMMAIALFVFGRIDGVARPAIAATMPSLGEPGLSLLVDAGANTEVEPLHLAQWGVLGSVFMQKAFALPAPKVGVVANGEEEVKGTQLTRDALAMLKKTDVALYGYAEGRDLPFGEVQVVVTDGFTGNVMLKTAEGVFKFITTYIKQQYAQGGVLEKLGGLLSKPVFARMKAEMDPREFGAAPLLGLKKPAFIAHGSSDAYAVRASIRLVRKYTSHDVVAAMTDAIARNAAAWEKPAAPVPAEAQADARASA